MVEHVHIYETLIGEGGAVVGALAYSIYKTQKVEWTKRYILDHSCAPDEAALKSYRTSSLLPSAIEGYIVRGQMLAQEFLNEGLKKRVEDIGVETRQSALALTMQEKIDEKFSERKSMMGWFKDAGTSIMTNIVALFIAGALILGIKGLDSLSAVVNDLAKHETPQRK